MATNAPYYQLRGQFGNGTNAQFAADDDEYDLSSSIAPHNASLYVDTQNPDNHSTALEDNHNLAELLEAATTAAGQAADAMNVDTSSSSRISHNRAKRKRTSSPALEDGINTASAQHRGDFPSENKRVRIDIPTDPQLHGQSSNTHGSLDRRSTTPSSETLLGDARAAGVHSAAALFRRSSKGSTRKYTRPPMSKLFMSLHLTPENFLQLQARAKAYMLDPDHPERQSCVGNRGKGDTDMVKLRLFNCVRDFLSDGAGDHFFGEHVETQAETDALDAARALGEDSAPVEGRLVWPRDGNQIISLVTPLLRRMVTNERQRMYAIETRKGGTKRKEGSAEATPGQYSNIADIDAMIGRNIDSEHLDPRRNESQSFAPQNLHSPQMLAGPSITSPPPPQDVTQQVPVPSPSFADGKEEQTSQMPKPKERSLPTANESVHDLRKIDIYLTRNGLKLKQYKRIKGPGVLADYGYHQLQTEIRVLIAQALSTYPQLRAGHIQSALSEQSMEPEALRGLAVAATEIQDSTTPNGGHGDAQFDPNSEYQHLVGGEARQDPTEQTPGQSVGLDSGGENSAQALASIAGAESNLPDYLSKVMTTQGLVDIKNPDDWKVAKLDVGFSTWAGGRLSVVVELV